MAEPIDGRLIYDALKDVRARLAHLAEMREGFASIRAHMTTQHADAAFLERRIIELERDMDRVKRRLELVDEPQGS